MIIKYTDTKNGFSLQLPGWWRRYIVVKRTSRLGDLQFLFKYKGKVYIDVLTVSVYRMTRKQWRAQYKDSPIIFLAERDGRIFAYSLPEEMPDEFLNKAGDDYDYKKYGRPIRMLRRMVNKDVPKIVKTLKLINRKTTR
ncbi:hypothetical protein [Cohnella yongneupensis]|uniref:Uncharacterized protein n=1 Tax=Cohnella yongneupensis TaxID=425006 RepID=A0ABW0QXJ6_9BACL